MSEPRPLAEQLLEQLWTPLVLGGDLRPLPPIGERRAAELGVACPDLQSIADPEAERARLYAARMLGPFDELPNFVGEDWLLLCALNDLLQVTDPHLTRLFGTGRPKRLLELCRRVVERAGPPRTVGEALERHATLSGVLGIVRVDTHVAWWVGSRDFSGQRPPARLLTWRRLRRVRIQEQSVPFSKIGDSAQAWASGWRDVAQRWLAGTPLTALAGADALGALFEWSASALSVIDCAPGRTLAHRAVERCSSRVDWLEVARHAAQALRGAGARKAALSFCDEVASRDALRRLSAGGERPERAAPAEARAAPTSESSSPRAPD